jgi:hypothetical protein
MMLDYLKLIRCLFWEVTIFKLLFQYHSLQKIKIKDISSMLNNNIKSRDTEIKRKKSTSDGFDFFLNYLI